MSALAHDFNDDEPLRGRALQWISQQRRGAEHLALVLADHTGVPALAITEDSPLYRRLAASPQPWAQLLDAHYRQYWQAYKRPSCLHDAAAASLPLGHDFVRGEDRVSDWNATDACVLVRTRERGCPPASTTPVS